MATLWFWSFCGMFINNQTNGKKCTNNKANRFYKTLSWEWTWKLLLLFSLAAIYCASPRKRTISLALRLGIFKDFIFREKGKKGEREGEKHQCAVASHMAPTGDLAHNPGMCPDGESNQQPLGLQPTLSPLSYTRQSSKNSFISKKLTCNSLQILSKWRPKGRALVCFICINALGHDIKQNPENWEKAQNYSTPWQLLRAPSSKPASPSVFKWVGCYRVPFQACCQLHATTVTFF